MRLGVQPGEELDRETTFSFRFNGQKVNALGGDTIASALLASGQRVLSRSYKYHRPRGVLTASYLDPGCFFQVGDEPNVRGAHRRAEPGMDVHSQNTWPSLAFDLKAANQLAGRFLGPGFYYKTFIKPQRLWPAYERVLQRFVHAGSVSPDTPRVTVDKRYAHPDVLVAGGGPAGMTAAVAAARAGARVMLVEEEYQLGGHLRWGGAEELAALASLRDDVAATPGIEVLTNSVVAGRYDDNWLAVVRRSGFIAGGAEQLIKARAKVLVVAPGLIERPYVFQGNDVPGVMLSTAARRLIRLHAVRPGKRAVVLTANADGDAAVTDLREAGVEIARVVDARKGGDLVRVRGHRGVRAVELADGPAVECDLVVTAVGWTAPTSLLNMAGDQPVYNPRAARFFPRDLPPTVLAAGGLAGDGGLDELTAHADAVGREAARRALRLRREWQAASWRSAVADDQPVAVPALSVDEHPELFRAGTHGMVDFCEDVSSKDIIAAVREGYDSIELAKRYTTATMGPTQGKLELVNAVAIAAEATGATIEETGTTTWRPPYAPVTLGALAGRPLEPVRYSPMQPWHEPHGPITTATRRPRPATCGPRSGSSTSPRSASWTCAVPTCPGCSTWSTSTSGPSWASAGSGTGPCAPRTGWCSTTASPAAWAPSTT
jgi:sarcosine oxidase subunit alpha